MSIRVVASAENNAYTAWQSKLFAYSCVSRLGLTPLIVVHTEHPETDPACEDFFELASHGVPVSMAPQYKNDHPTGILYHPRNTPGSLLLAADICEADYLMLCDTDLVFVKPFDLPRPNPVSAAWYWPIVQYKTESVQEAARAMGVDLDPERQDLRCGVPYLVERTVAKELAECWLEAIDLMDPLGSNQMYAWGIACVKLGITIGLGDVIEFNEIPKPLKPGAAIIHYGFRSDGWTKRDYCRPKEIRNVWTPKGDVARDTVTGEIHAQLREAGEFYAAAREIKALLA